LRLASSFCSTFIPSLPVEFSLRVTLGTPLPRGERLLDLNVSEGVFKGKDDDV
jgi:hypothetical protein